MEPRAALIPRCLAALGLVAGLACGSEDGVASPPPSEGPPPVDAPAASGPAPVPTEVAPRAQSAPAGGTTPARAESEATSAAEGTTEAPVPALEDLMRLPASSQPRSRDLLADIPPPPPDATPEERAAWRERIRIERRSSEIGPSGPRQGTYSETDAAVRVPVSDRVQLEGGVRVNEREEPGRESREGDRGSSSRVGVEVQF